MIEEEGFFMKSKWVSFFLCLFLGVLGIHKFYEGKVLLPEFRGQH